VKICSLYGAGYYYMPGTDICLKLGGYVRYQLNVGTGNNISGGPQHGIGGLNTRFTNNEVNQRVRALISIDTRQQTAYGTLRSYMILGYSHDVPTSGAAALYVNRGFVQIAGFTFGKATSYFDIFPNASFAYNAGNNFSGDSGDGGVIGLWYTAQFGNGFSGSIGIEQSRRQSTIYTHGVGGVALAPVGATGALAAANNYGGTGSTLPDLVGNLRLDQSWGTWIVAAALHEVSGGYYGPALATAGEAFGNPGRDFGWAVTTGFILNTPFITPGDRFSVQAVYSQGATGYHVQTRGTGQPTYYSGNQYSFGVWSDAVFAGNTGVNSFEQTTAWSINAAFEHRWTPSLKTSWYGSYIDVSYNGAASALLCVSGGNFAAAAIPASGVVPAGPAGCDPDWNAWTAGSRTEWEPVKGLTFGVDVIYQQIQSSSPAVVSAVGVGTPVIAPGAGKQAMNYVTDDQGVWSASFRVQRNFLP
jgi:Porin subfamily